MYINLFLIHRQYGLNLFEININAALNVCRIICFR